jgi:DNA-binding response OmpR family regulator
MADVGEAVREGDFDELQMQLTAYSETIETAHRDLLDSGRDAVKKPGGFKELEIALRQHIRRFDELSRMLNLQNRVPVEKTKGLATGIRDKLLKALFP